MGFTKKSLLALVLALVMVLGMAMPTAFAATGPVAVEFVGASGSLGVGAAGAATGLVVGTEYEYELWNNYTTGGAYKFLLSTDDLGATPKYEYWVSGPLTVSLDEGILAVTPYDVGPASVKVKVSHPADESWPGYGAILDSFYWEGTISFTGTVPTAKFNPVSIVLDNGDAAKKIATISTSDFTTKPVTTNVVIKSVSPMTGIASVAKTSDTVYTVMATAAGDATLNVVLTINGVDTASIPIPLHIGDSTKDDYTLATDIPAAGLVLERNASSSQLVFNLTIKDKAGNVTRPVGTNRLDAFNKTGTYVATFVPDPDGMVLRNPSGTNSIDWEAVATTGVNFADNGRVQLVLSQNLVSFKGRVDITYVGAAHGKVLYTSFPLTINPAPLTASPQTVVIDKAKNDQGAIKNPTGLLTLSSTLGTLTTTAPAGTGAGNYGTDFTIPTVAGLQLDPALTNGFVAGTNYQFRFVVDATTPTGTYDASVLSFVTPTTGGQGYWTGAQKFKIQVVDTTPKPVFTPKSASVDSDLSTTTKVEFDITNMLYALPTQHAFGGLTHSWDPAAGAPNFKWETTDVPQTDISQAGKGTFSVTTLATPYNGTLTIKGTVDGEKIADVKIPVTAAERTAGKPHHFVATPNPIATKLGTPTNFTISVYDYLGTLIDQVASVDQTANVLSSDVTLFGVTNVPGALSAMTNNYTVTGLKAGTGKITITGTAAAGLLDCTKAMPLVIPVTVEGIKMTANKTSLDYDLATKTATANPKVAVQLTVDATTGIDWSGISVTTTPLSWLGAPIPKGNGLYEFELLSPPAVVTTNASATISGVKVNGFAVDSLKLPIVVTNSAKLIASPTELTLQPDDPSKVEGYVQVSANPAHGAANILAVTSAVSSNPAVATIELVAAPGANGAAPAFASYKVKGIAKGEALITFQGTSNGNALQSVSVKVTVGESTKPVLVVTPNPIALDMTTNKEVTLAVTSSVAGTTVTDVKVTYTGDVVTVDGMKVTAAKVGTGSLTVDGKIDGIAAATVTVPITVTEAPVITGDFLVNGAPGTTGSLFVRNSTANNQYKLTLNGYTGAVTWKSSNKSILKFIDAPAGKASSTKTGTEVQWVQVLKAGTVKVTATPATGTAKSITFKITTEAETGFTVGDQALLVGQRASAKPEIVPATAKTKGFKFKSSDKKVVTVSSKGILVAKKAGTATITVTPKKKGLAKQTFTVTVTVDYKNLNYNSVVLLQNSDGKPNADADNVKKIFESARFDASGNAAGANILAATATKADVKAAIATMALASKNTSDISNFYFAGAATKTGLTFTDGEYSYTDLANDLAKCTGNVVVFLDCTGGNRLINAKAASDADIFAAFSKAVKPGLSTMTNSAVEKLSFTVFTSTAKAKTTVTPTVSADGSSVQYKFTKLFAETLKVSDSNTISVGTNGIVNVKQLWAKLKAAKGSVWASKKSVMPIYGYVPAAPVTP